MATQAMLASVKSALGITGTFMDATVSGYIDTVTAYMSRAGVSDASIANSAFVVARGVNDIWNNNGAVAFSPLFRDLVSQLALTD